MCHVPVNFLLICTSALLHYVSCAVVMILPLCLSAILIFTVIFIASFNERLALLAAYLW